MKAPITQTGALPSNAQDCEIGFFIGLNGQKRIVYLRPEMKSIATNWMPEVVSDLS
jgi:hypothetical protein